MSHSPTPSRPATAPDDDAVGRIVVDAYRDGGPGVRFHTRVRRSTAPHRELEREIPRRGHILDFGCGHGVLSLELALHSPARTIEGVDVDGVKIEHARTAAGAAGLDHRVTLHRVGSEWTPPPSHYDAVVVSDVLYVLGPDRVGPVLDALAASVVPGGVVVVQETSLTPAWHFRLARLQETVSVRLLGLTAATTIDFVPVEFVEARLRRMGLAVTSRRLSPWRPHPQFVVVGRRPAGSVSDSTPGPPGTR